MSGILIDGITGPFSCVDAHLDEPGPQSGGWGSAEQLGDMHLLAGALRAVFCEVDGRWPADGGAHLHAADHIIQDLMPQHQPAWWELGRQFWRHVEGLESLGGLMPMTDMVLERFRDRGVCGVTPVYHRGNPMAGSAGESDKPLNDAGLRLVFDCWMMDWWVDLAHMNRTSAALVIAVTDAYRREQRKKALVTYTHGGIQHDEIVHPIIKTNYPERCLTPALALGIVRAGGLVCLSPVKPFYERLDGPFVEHIQMLGEASDWQFVGIGTDYGGVLDEWRLPGCDNVANCFRQVIITLLEAGISEQHVRQVVGLNAARFFNLQIS